MSMRSFLFGLLLIVAGFASGWFMKYVTSGYIYKIRHEKQFQSPAGSIYLRDVTESIGLPFLDPGTCEVTILAEDGPITIYKARRVFQESYYDVNDLAIEGDSIRWEDGKNKYTLLIEKVDVTPLPAR